MIYWENVHILLVPQKSRLQTSMHNVLFKTVNVLFLKKYIIEKKKKPSRAYNTRKLKLIMDNKILGDFFLSLYFFIFQI